MNRRAERYEENIDTAQTKTSRTSKNKYLYDEINNKIGYEEIINFDNNSKIDFSKLSSYNNREDYQKIKDYKVFERETQKPEEKISEVEPKEYDINVILEEAKKNREKYDELESKRKLKENSYVKLADINEKHEQSYFSRQDIDEEELTNLINTITSHNLLSDIKKEQKKDDKSGEVEILSDLLATSADKKITDGIAKEFTSQEKKIIDNSFYTKSMDLSEQDFELSEEIESENKIRLKITLTVIALLIIVAIIAFIFLKSKGIIKI